MAVAAVTLDGAGTLFEVAEPVGETYAGFARRHGMSLAPDDTERRFRAAFAAAPPLAFPGGSPTRLADHERAWWYALVRRAFGPASGAAGFDACFADLFAHYARPEAWRVFPEVPSALEELRERGLRLALVSNFDQRLVALVAGLGLATLFDAMVHSSAAGAAKPDPAIFRTALCRLGVEPGDALHAGDDPERDVGGASGAGMHAVLVDRAARRSALPGDAPRITRLDELPRIVDLLSHVSLV
jgi:putative hydrolase of the HAD superfamily